jgi:hypothetical protein
MISEMFVGIDVSKACLDVACLPEEASSRITHDEAGMTGQYHIVNFQQNQDKQGHFQINIMPKWYEGGAAEACHRGRDSKPVVRLLKRPTHSMLMLRC